MTDKPPPAVVEALGRAAAEPDGCPLHGSKNAPGLFAVTAQGRHAAEHCKRQGYLQVLRTELRGKTAQEICGITEKGLTYLLEQASPRAVLAELVRALDGRRQEIAALAAAAQHVQAGLEALRERVERVLESVGKPAAAPLPASNGSAAWQPALVTFLTQWQATHPAEDCPLRVLLAHAREHAPGLTIGQFHDGLRRLHDSQVIYLHPWSGPLCDLPEPPVALLVGHEIAYYASLRVRS